MPWKRCEHPIKLWTCVGVGGIEKKNFKEKFDNFKTHEVIEGETGRVWLTSHYDQLLVILQEGS